MTKLKDLLIKTSIEISRIILGATFIFSGYVKSIDPMGTVYKIQDYLTAFHLTNLHSLALLFSFILCAGEFCLGVFMLLGLYRKWTSRIMFILMLFMTPLTLYLAIANPVQDCGCFGDALIITNWQTFFKNVILIIGSIITLKWYERITNLFTGKFYWLVGIYIVMFSFGFCLYNYYNNPIIDFRPYRIGNNIAELMKVDSIKAPVYENVLVYEKDGVQKEFSEENYPWQDSTWVFVDRKSKLVKEGEEPTIQDFIVNRLYLNLDRTEIEGTEDITTELLADTAYTFLMVTYSLKDLRETYFSRFEDLNNYAKDYHYKFYCLTSSTKDEILSLEKENITNFNFCLTDERTLKTMIRTNPGLILLKGGTVVNKWADRNTPDESFLKAPIEELSLDKPIDPKKESERKVFMSVIILLLPLFGVKFFDAIFYQIRRKKNNQQ